MRRLAIAVSLLATAHLPSIAEAASAEVVFSTASGAVVVVEALGAGGDVRTLGSGVVVAPGLIITNFHVVQNGRSFVVRQAEKKQPASVVASDARRDLSLLRVKDSRLAAISMRASSSLRVGERVFAIGAPEGLDLSLSEGLVSAIRPVSDGSYIQTSAAISHGSSGGGLFDSTGRLVGITTFSVVKGQNLNFAIPTEWITALLNGESTKRGKLADASGRLSADALNPAELSAADSYRTASELYILAESQLSRPGNEAVAKETLLEATRIRPDYGPAWSGLAAIQLRLGDLPGALTNAQEGVRVSPDAWITWLTLYYVYDMSKRLDEAGLALDEALKRNPTEPQILMASADLSRGRKDYAAAITKYRNLISADPQNAAAWHSLGNAQEGRGNNAEARASFRESIRIKPDSASVWLDLGSSYMLDDRPADAIEPYQRASRLDPTWSVPCSGLCKALNNANRLEEARAQALGCVEKFPSDAESLLALGIIHCRLGEREALLDVHERLHRIEPKQADKLFRNCLAPR